MYKVNVIGTGIIGQALLEDMAKKNIDEIYGTDIDPEVIEKLKKKGYNISDKIQKNCDVYIISVLTTDQVISIIKEIDIDHDPLVVVESTIEPETAKKILKKRRYIKLVIFPHRYYEKDPKYRVFNLTRVMGAVSDEALREALEFYSRYMDKKLIHITDIKTAEICKSIENWIRYAEISISEELKIYLTELGYDFEEIRRACNTKWNIDIKEARDGIGGHCLEKDTKMVNDIMEGNFMINAALNTDIVYKEIIKKWKKIKK